MFVPNVRLCLNRIVVLRSLRRRMIGLLEMMHFHEKAANSMRRPLDSGCRNVQRRTMTHFSEYLDVRVSYLWR